ncbi:permease [Thermoproteota archaeon]
MKKNRLFWVFVVYAAVFILGWKIAFFNPLSTSLWMYVNRVSGAIIFGLFLGGVIDWLVPREYISSLLASKRKRSIIYAVGTGFFMAACSHGILAIAIQLYKKGASGPAVVAFLLASPWANLPLTILMFGFFGFKAFVIIISAIVVALISGYIFLGLQKLNWIERNPNTIEVKDDFSILQDIRNRMKDANFTSADIHNALIQIINGAVSLADMILWWILVGLLMASIAAAYIPSGFMQAYMGASVVGLLATLLLATVMEICSEGTAPLAFEIYRQTGALGNSFVFLMAGVVTDYTEIGLLWTNVGKRTAIWLPVVAVPQVIILGYIFNLILS